jgi:4-coumarate--CoA ligase
VSLAVVVCLDDPLLTYQLREGEERPRAYVHLKDSAKGRVNEDSVHRWMKDRVAKYKQLTGGVAFVDEVPKLQSGKIVRKVIKGWASRDALAMKKAPLARL